LLYDRLCRGEGLRLEDDSEGEEGEEGGGRRYMVDFTKKIVQEVGGWVGGCGWVWVGVFVCGWVWCVCGWVGGWVCLFPPTHVNTVLVPNAA